MQPLFQNNTNESYRFEALFNHVSMGIVVVNDEGSIQSVNPFALQLFDYTIEELVEKPMEILIPQRYHYKYINHRNKYTHDPKSQPIGVGMDLFAVKKNGTEFPVEVSLGNYQCNQEQNVIIFISDISIRKKVEAEIAKLNDELKATVQERTKALKETLRQKELSELKTRFVSMASHEFRTPLSTILSSTYLIEKYTTTDEQPKREKHLQRIISSVEMLTDILNDFLSVGKIEEGKIQVKPLRFNIQNFIITTIGEIKSTLKKQQKIEYQHKGNSEVIADASLLKHIIMNLISNASKFSPDKSVIEIKTIHNNYHTILSVKDYGIGILKEDQKHLMERFFRGTNAGNIQGTGLGLHIVSKYAELMNGTVKYISEPGKGTEFIITFNTQPDGDENNFVN